MAGRRDHDRGFSLVELLMLVAVLAIVTAIAVPSLQDIVRSMRLGNVTRQVERELQSARLKAVSSNRKLRVRMNCPTVGFYRTVEVLGTAADTADNRCVAAAYPYPPDTDPLTLPNQDGPVRPLDQQTTVATVNIQFDEDGTASLVSATGVVTEIPAGGTSVTVTQDTRTKTINVNALGKITIQ